MYSQNDWRAYQEYEYALEHKFSLPKINLSGAKKKITDAVKKFTNKSSSTSTKTSEKKSSTNKNFSVKNNSNKKVSEKEKKESTPVAKPGKWTWPEGKNSKEYNHWYYENHTKIKRMNEAIESGQMEEPVFNGKRWSEMSDLEKQAYMDKNNESNNAEMFISQFLQRPLSLFTGNVGGYVNAAARDFLADYAYVKTAKQTVDRKLSDGEVDKETGFKKKTKQMSREEDLNQVNPGFYNWNTNSKNNCMLCTTTYDLRRRGYDVTANKSTDGFETGAVNDWYPDAEIKTVKSDPIPTIKDSQGREYLTSDYWNEQPARAEKNAKKLIKELEKQPDGARGNLMVTWAGFSGGHSMVYEIVDGEVMILDGQSNKIYDSNSEIMDLLSNCDGDLNYARLDNVDVDPEAIKRASKS